jgi:hypothetical protein
MVKIKNLGNSDTFKWFLMKTKIILLIFHIVKVKQWQENVRFVEKGIKLDIR